MKKQPHKEIIRDLIKSEGFKYFLERVALYLNNIDTVRNIDPADPDWQAQLLARRLAIEIIESAMADILPQKELLNVQRDLASQEETPVKTLKDLSADLDY